MEKLFTSAHAIKKMVIKRNSVRLKPGICRQRICSDDRMARRNMIHTIDFDGPNVIMLPAFYSSDE
jgi:hypothetical protein